MSLPKSSPSGLYTLTIKNDSGSFTNDQIYIFAKGVNINYGKAGDPKKEIPIANIPPILLDNGTPVTNVKPAVPTHYKQTVSVITFDKATGIGTVEAVDDKSKNSSDYSYKLSDFPVDDSGKITLKIPKLNSGRMYFSIGKALTMTITEGLTPVVFTSGDDQGDEVLTPLTLTFAEPNGAVSGNPDYYTIYDKIEFSYNDSGSWFDTTSVDFYGIPMYLSYEKTPGDSSTKVTKGITQSRSTVLDAFTNASDGLPASWNNLYVKYGGQTLRVLAPQKISNTPPFDSFFTDYIDAVWKYYENNSLTINCQELWGKKNKAAKNYVGTVSGGLFTFKIDPSELTGVGVKFPSTVEIAKPSSSVLFLCTTGPFQAKNTTILSVLVKTLAAALNVGLLPLANDPVLYDKHFGTLVKDFYQPNALIPTVTNSYNLYAKILHQWPNESIYAFPYDDVLGQDSTVHFEPGEEQPTALTIGNMTGTALPSNSGTGNFSANFTVGAGASGTIINSKGVSTSLVVQGPPINVTDLNGIFSFTYNMGQGDQIVFVNANEPSITEGFGTITADGNVLTIKLNGVPPPSPGTPTGLSNHVPLAITFVVGGAAAGTSGVEGHVNNEAKTPLPQAQTVPNVTLKSPFTITYGNKGEPLNQYSIDAANNLSNLPGVVVKKTGAYAGTVSLPGSPVHAPT